VLNSLDEGGHPAGTGADLAEDLPALQLAVGSFVEVAPVGVRVVDLALAARHRPTRRCRIQATATLPHAYRGVAALGGGVSHRLHPGGVDDLDDAMLAGAPMSCRAPGRAGEAQISRPGRVGDDLHVNPVALVPAA
jgi:hypothetical protein